MLESVRDGSQSETATFVPPPNPDHLKNDVHFISQFNVKTIIPSIRRIFGDVFFWGGEFF
jgi:hypothetical protein